jgi:hypothetical protein
MVEKALTARPSNATARGRRLTPRVSENAGCRYIKLCYLDERMRFLGQTISNVRGRLIGRTMP